MKTHTINIVKNNATGADNAPGDTVADDTLKDVEVTLLVMG